MANAAPVRRGTARWAPNVRSFAAANARNCTNVGRQSKAQAQPNAPSEASIAARKHPGLMWLPFEHPTGLQPRIRPQVPIGRARRPQTRAHPATNGAQKVPNFRIPPYPGGRFFAKWRSSSLVLLPSKTIGVSTFSLLQFSQNLPGSAVDLVFGVSHLIYFF